MVNWQSEISPAGQERLAPFKDEKTNVKRSRVLLSPGFLHIDGT